MSNKTTEIRISVDATCIYCGFSIKMTNTHKRQVLYSVREKKTKGGWEDLPHSASRYIVNDFKKTPEHDEMLSIIEVASYKYGY